MVQLAAAFVLERHLCFWTGKMNGKTSECVRRREERERIQFLTDGRWAACNVVRVTAVVLEVDGQCLLSKVLAFFFLRN